jgi:hypothetical protein
MFSGRGENKLLSWREFRNGLEAWPEDIDSVVKKWAQAPISSNYLTYENSKKWPDAWTLISDSVFCDISIALGMFYTLYYSSYDYKDTMKIEHYHLPKDHLTLNLVSLEDGKYMLNYHSGRSVNILMTADLPSPKYIVTANDLPIKN